MRYVPISEHGLCFRICLCNYVTSQEREKAPIKIEMNLTRLLYLIYLLVFPLLLKIISFTKPKCDKKIVHPISYRQKRDVFSHQSLNGNCHDKNEKKYPV